jgi:hypothetical protein
MLGKTLINIAEQLQRRLALQLFYPIIQKVIPGIGILLTQR